MVLGLLCFEILPPKPNTIIKNKKKEIIKNRACQINHLIMGKKMGERRDALSR